jgi:putative heme-binding domain-containing protein
MRDCKILIATAMLWIAGASVVGAQNARTSNPVEGNAEAMGRGSLLFRARCAGCHGLDAKGVNGPDLTAALGGMNDERFFKTVRNGQGVEMPRFDSIQTTDVQVWEILSHLRGLARGEAAETIHGDAANGARIFQTRCMGCHRVNGKGGALGPDLSRIGALRSPSALARKVRDPNQALVSGFRPVTLVLSDGKRVRGVGKNEDAFSIQIMDMTERIQGFSKRDLREIIREPRSPMPVFGAEQLNNTDLNDLVSHLLTLRQTSTLVH